MHIDPHCRSDSDSSREGQPEADASGNLKRRRTTEEPDNPDGDESQAPEPPSPARAMTAFVFPKARGSITAAEELPWRNLGGHVRTLLGPQAALGARPGDSEAASGDGPGPPGNPPGVAQAVQLPVTVVLDGACLLLRLLQGGLDMPFVRRRGDALRQPKGGVTATPALRFNVAGPGPSSSESASASAPSAADGDMLDTTAGCGEPSTVDSEPEPGGATVTEPMQWGLTLQDAITCAVACGHGLPVGVHPPASESILGDATRHIRKALVKYLWALSRESGCPVHVVFATGLEAWAGEAPELGPSRLAATRQFNRGLRIQQGAAVSHAAGDPFGVMQPAATAEGE